MSGRLSGDRERRAAVLVVWDAPGFGVAEAVLGRLIPRLQDREHVVILHDVSDRRYAGSPASYGEAGLWRGTDWAMREGRYDCRLYLGWVDTLMEHVISVLDFLARNGAELQSADHSFQQEIGANPERRAEMEGLLSPQDWSLLGHWAYFSLTGAPKPYTFPRV